MWQLLIRNPTETRISNSPLLREEAELTIRNQPKSKNPTAFGGAGAIWKPKSCNRNLKNEIRNPQSHRRWRGRRNPKSEIRNPRNPKSEIRNQQSLSFSLSLHLF
ncbi:MAG: hypothetical protein IPF68_13325 [Bacteroidales bacterium]|nr:hypothetical protein [Bacteroidales bacterium]